MEDRFTVIFDFALGDRVLVIGSGAEGMVTARLQSWPGSIEYKVLAYVQGVRTENWYYEQELERRQ